MEAMTAILVLFALVSPQTVRQGAPDAVAIPNIFQSPMVIETIFAATDRATWGRKGWLTPPEYHALGAYTCDGVSLRGGIFNEQKRWGNRDDWDAGLAMRATERPGGLLDVAIRAEVMNPNHNHDKNIMLFLEVLADSTVIGSGVIGPVPAKDNGNSREAGVKITVPIAAIKTDPPTTLRITLTTKDY